MFGGPWDSTLILMGVPSLKMGVPSFYIYKIIGKPESLRNNLGFRKFGILMKGTTRDQAGPEFLGEVTSPSKNFREKSANPREK